MPGAVILENLGYLMRGLATTGQLALVSFGLACLGGIGLALLRASRWGPASYPAVVYIESVRGIPLVMVIFWVYFFLPVLTRQAPNAYLSSLIALTAYTAAYLAEIFRAGILSVPRGQVDAALASGLRFLQAMVHVVLPQALRNMLPAIINQFVSLFKGTSLVFIIGVVDFFRAAVLVDSREFKSFPIYAFVGVVYLVICTLLSALAQRLRSRVAMVAIEI